MKLPYLLPALAVLGLAVAAYVVFDTNRPAPPPASDSQAVSAPFATYVVGAGITETGRGNVAVGTAVSGVVSDLYIKVGESVAVGAPLFKIDDRDQQAQLAVARAKVHELEAALAKPRHRLEFLARLQRRDNSAISTAAISDARDDARAAESLLDSAKAGQAQIEVEIQRGLVRAPTAGRILQLNVRVGEYVEGSGQSRPLLLLGNDSRMFLRVDIDENDAWRIRPEARARAYLRGNPAMQAPLKFEYIEPVEAPKSALTGQITERSDVRVLQVIYSFERGRLPIFLGQQMDVYVEAAPLDSPGDTRKP